MKDPIKMIKKAQEQDIPTFTVKATDKHSYKAVAKYFQAVSNDPEVSEEFKNEIEVIFKEFFEFQQDNKSMIKIPD